MMIRSNARTPVTVARVSALAMLTTLLSAPWAHAQAPDAPLLVLPPLTTLQRPLPPPAVVGPGVPDTRAAGFWELISGYEGDSHGSGHGFFGPSYVRPIRPGLSWTARAFGSYLSYGYTGFDGDTHVRSPGVSSAAGLQFGDRSFVRVLAGPEVKWRRTKLTDAAGVSRSETDARLGANFGGEMYANPAPHTNLQGLVNYNTSDRYTWGRLGLKEQVGNRDWSGPTATFLGVEGILQGNHDIRSRQVGGFFEISHTPARVSIMFKAGYKRSTFNAGPDKTGPYFSVGLYRRLN
jgi:hypothetical protein